MMLLQLIIARATDRNYLINFIIFIPSFESLISDISVLNALLLSTDTRLNAVTVTVIRR